MVPGSVKLLEDKCEISYFPLKKCSFPEKMWGEDNWASINV